MSYQVKFCLRERNGELRAGYANDNPTHAGWRDVVGVPASKRYGTQLNYNPAYAEREAVRVIKDKVIVSEYADECARNHQPGGNPAAGHFPNRNREESVMNKSEPLPKDIRLYGEACDEFFDALHKGDYKAFVRADRKCDEISTKYNWRGLAANRKA